MSQQIKNLLIGLFVIAACISIVSIVLFLKPTVGDGKKTFHVRFTNINGISIGTRVLFAGMPVGEITSIEELYDARSQPTNADGDVYFYQLTLKVDSSVEIYNTDQLSIQTSGLLGERSITIIPKAPPPGVKPYEITNQPIYAESEDPIQKTVDQLGSLARKVESAIDNLHQWMDDNGDNISFAVKSFGCAMDQIYFTVSDINQQRLVQEFKGAAQNFNLTMRDIQEAMDQLRDANVFKNAGVVVENLKNATHSIEVISQDIANGKGTIGKLIKQDDMYLRVTAILSKVNTLMDDINHYGVLFHLNKSWQRLRTQRITAMNALDTPADFRNFFTTEIDQINTSMARLSKLIEKAENSPSKQEIMESTPFKRDFAELLRDVDDLRSNLRLYNQQLMEAQGM